MAEIAHILSYIPHHHTQTQTHPVMLAHPQYMPVPTIYDQVQDPGYVYPILITGMAIFMASNAMHTLLPEAQRIM
jgi:hypothetical protein